VQEKVFETWEVLAVCAQHAVEAGTCDVAVVRELAGEFLKKTIAAMEAASRGHVFDTAKLAMLQAQAIGVSGVVRNVGKGVLTKEDVIRLVKVLMELLGRVGVGVKEPVKTTRIKRNRKEEVDVNRGDDLDACGADDEGTATKQSLRFCLADIAGSLMRSSCEHFVEVGLPGFMELVQRLLRTGASDADRSLALYIADDAVECLGERSVPYWNLFMEHACKAITAKSAEVQQYACSIVGNAAPLPIFAQVAPAAATQLACLLQKRGERHRSRRAVSAEAKQDALAVDASISALGLVCEHQEQHIGGDTSAAWGLWLSNLPLRYDQDEAQKSHSQLLGLVSRCHPVVSAAEQLPRVLAIFSDIYKTRFSNVVLDREIAAAIASAGGGLVQTVSAGLPEKQQRKVQAMLADGHALES
jgi:hypothetical protein